jgi:hypothetical protein
MAGAENNNQCGSINGENNIMAITEAAKPGVISSGGYQYRNEA